MSEASFATTPPAAEGPEAQSHGNPPHWSDRAQRRLLQARVIGLIMVFSGAVAFIMGNTLSGIVSSFMSNGGLTLLVTGLVMIAAVMRTHGISPAQAFGPSPIVQPRMWFVLLWGAGIALVVVLNAIAPTPTTEQVIMLMLATPLMVVGGLWILRWLSGQLARQWPLAAAAMQWVPNWTVIWAGVWGLISTLAAFVIEAAPLLLMTVLFRSSFVDISRSTLTPFESLTRALHNPVLIVMVLFGAIVAAPLIEEAVKALGLHWLRPWIQHPSNGWLLGLAAGLGFGMLEGAFNLDSTTNWVAGGWVRLAALLLHGLTTSLTGLGYARYLQSQQRRDLWRGYSRAVIMHGAWNASAIGLAAAASATLIGLNVFVACGSAFASLGLIVFMIVLIRRVSKAGVQTSIQEDIQQAGLRLPIAWQPMKFNLGWRLVGSRPVYATTEVAATAEVVPAPESGAPPSGDYTI